MYLISIYFDEQSDRQIRNYINAVAMATGNTFMQDNNVPPHITVAAFETRDEKLAESCFDRIAKKLGKAEIKWVTVGSFMSSVIYIMPVLNEYLHNICKTAYEELRAVEGVKINEKYKPFNWLPHATIGKCMTGRQLITAFETMQNRFTISDSQVTEIGLARTKPFCNLKEYRF